MKRAKRLGPPRKYVASVWVKSVGGSQWEKHSEIAYKRRGWPSIKQWREAGTLLYAPQLERWK